MEDAADVPQPLLEKLQAALAPGHKLSLADALTFADLTQAQAFKQTQTALQPGTGWQAALVLSIPFYDGGLRSGIRKEREASDEEAT